MLAIEISIVIKGISMHSIDIRYEKNDALERNFYRQQRNFSAL